jgi:hypothetical protein
MLVNMTKATFKKAVDERRFVVRQVTPTQFEVLYISHDENSNTFNMLHVVNPDSKNGNFRQTGGGYNKAHSTIEDVAYYVNHNAEDKDSNDLNCVQYLQQNQRWNEI